MVQTNFKQYGTPLRAQLNLLDFTTSASKARINANKLPPAVAAAKREWPTSKAVQYASMSYQLETEWEDVCEPTTKLSKRSRVIHQIILASRFDNVRFKLAHTEPKQRCKVCGCYVRMKPEMQLSLVCCKRKELLSDISCPVTSRTHSSGDDLSFITSVLSVTIFVFTGILTICQTVLIAY